MSSPFRSIASIDTTFRSIQPSPIPPADQDQLICVNTINSSSTNPEEMTKNDHMMEIIDPDIVPCVPIYGLFSQTATQIKNTQNLFAMFSEYEHKMRVVTSSKKGKEISTSAAVELRNEGSNAICNFTLEIDDYNNIRIQYQYVDKDLTKYNTPFTEHMNSATARDEFLHAMGLLIIENIFLYGLDGVTMASHGCQGTFFMYYNRPLGGEGFHKDSTGNTSFVCLNYLNTGVLPSATIVLHPTQSSSIASTATSSSKKNDSGEFDEVNDTLDKIIKIIDIPHCEDAQITKRYNMGPYGTIGFNDLVVAHSSPFDETSKNVRSFSALVTTPGPYGQSVPSPLSGKISGSPHPPLESYPDANIPRNFTRMWINFKDPSVAEKSVVAFPPITITSVELTYIITNCQQKSMRAKKCLSVEELCASFIDPIHNTGKGTCFRSLSRGTSPATISQNFPYRLPSTTTTPTALEMGIQPVSLFRPVAVAPAPAPAPIGSSLTTTTTLNDDLVDYNDDDDVSITWANNGSEGPDLYKQMNKKRDDEIDANFEKMGGSRGGALRGHNKKTKRRHNKVTKKISHNKVTKRKGKRNKITKRKEGGGKTGKRNNITKKHKRGGVKRTR